MIITVRESRSHVLCNIYIYICIYKTRSYVLDQLNLAFHMSEFLSVQLYYEFAASVFIYDAT